MKEVVLIDGNSLLFRAYFAMRPMVNSKGIHTQGVFAFVNMLNKILRDYEPEYIAVAFDMKGGTFRHDVYKEYKAGRQQTPPELLAQIPLMHKVLGAMNIAVLEKEKYEADDIIGTLAKDASNKGFSTLIITGDKDELQLIDDNINVLITKKGISEFDIYDIDMMNERYGLSPAGFIDLKGLMGDSSDNIPGISGIGEKKGLALLHEYGNLESVLEHADEIKGKMGENVRAGRESAVLSKWLATINTDSPVEYTWDELKYTKPDIDKLTEIYTELEFNQFLKQLRSSDETVSFAGSGNKAGFDEELSSIKRTGASEFFAESVDGSDIYIELATDCSHISEPEIHALALYNAERGIAYLSDSQIEIMSAAAEIARGSYRLSGAGLKKVLYSLISINNEKYETGHDITIAEYLLDPNRQKYPMDKMMLRHLGISVSDNNAMILADDINNRSDGITSEDCLIRAFYSSKIKDVQTSMLDENGLKDLFEKCEMPLIFILASMEYQGIRCDAEVLMSIGEELTKALSGFEESIYKQAGHEFNINSPKQLSHILFDEMAIPYPKQKNKSGTYSTAADILEKLKADNQIVDDVLNYRKLNKLNSTYVEGLLPLIGHDGKVRPHFMQTVAATGRLSCTEPNLQNIPVRDDYGRLIRKAFITDNPDNVFVGSDYSQIELRILASLSGDESLISDFKSGKDIHRATASRVFGISEDDVTPLDRTKAKAVNFGVVYGMSGFGLGESLNITRGEAQKYISDYFEKHSAVKTYLDKRIEEGENERQVRTYFGRIRQIPEFASRKFMERELAKRLAMNTPIQGTAADIIKIAMNSVSDELRKRNLKSKLILQIHDELIVEGPKSEEQDVRELLDSCMKNAADLAVDLVCDIHSAETWYDLK